jgi:hypothetical protein
MDERRDFDIWLVEMDDSLEQLFEELPEKVTEVLDYTPGSLSHLERWMLQSFPSREAMLEIDRYLPDRLSCYVGETFRKSLGGMWDIELTDESYAYYGIPILTKDGVRYECPLGAVGTALHRRQGDFLERLLRVKMEYHAQGG